MPSLVILMIEAEQPEGLSSRKLVIETAKHNVITAYTMEDGLDLLRRFPDVDAVFVHAALLDQNPELLESIRKHTPDMPLILAAPFGNARSEHADFILDSHNPHEILRVLHGEIKPRCSR